VPANVTIVSDPERPVVAVHPPRVVKEVAEAVVAAEGEEAAAEAPEVIGEKKEKEEDKEKEKDKDKEKDRDREKRK
jgi:hypothetical protein